MSEAIIGRERELHVVAEFLTDLERGPTVLVLIGEPGIGKTTIWHEAVARARECSFRVLSARPAEAEAGLAFAGLADLLEPVVDEVLPQLPEPQQRALAVALLREDSGPGRLDQRAVSAATTGALRALARMGPLVLAVDDLQWLDRPSARVVDFAVRRLADVSVGVLASERVDRGVGVPLAFDKALPVEGVRRVKLGPLSVAALHQLLKARLGRSFTRRMVVRIQRATGGNPFFAVEIARSLPDDASASVATLPMPDRLLEVVEGRVFGLPEEAREVLLAVAALRAPTIERVITATVGTPVDARQVLDLAESQHIIRVEGSRLRFTHPLFGSVVYGLAPPAARRRIHRRLGNLVTDVEESARHLALAAEGADVELADVLDRAADQARARGAPDTAAEFVEFARLLTPEECTVDLQRRSIQAADDRLHSGELRSARELLEAVLRQVPTGRVLADALRLMGEIHYHQESFPDAVRLFEEALLHVSGDPQVESAIELRLAFCLRGLGDFAGAMPHGRRALWLAEQVEDSALLAEALAMVARLDFVMGRGLDAAALDRALELQDPHRQVPLQLRPGKIAGDLLVYAGQLERALEILERERERALERGDESELPFVLSHMTWAACWQGNLDTAAAYAAESLEIAGRLEGPSIRCLALAFSALVAAHRGEATNARQWADEAIVLAELTGWHTPTVWARWALGALAISLEDAKAVDAALGSLTALVEKEGIPEPIRAVFLADEIEALIRLGELDRAALLIEMLDEAGRRLQRDWAIVQAGRCRALQLAASNEIDQAAQSARAALAAGDALELRLELARTFLVAGQIERRRKRKKEARELLTEALSIFDDAGAEVWARRTRLELERAAPKPTGDELTASEQRVAQLAASGLTNREVAAKLFMSPKTVEANLARIYRKLGIRSRAQLGARLGVGQTSAPQ
jgi:DNA-binding CsgD family transcriptional regulator/tetratricopeptide (TPR) repeat protein